MEVDNAEEKKVQFSFSTNSWQFAYSCSKAASSFSFLFATLTEGTLTTLLGVDQASPSSSKSGASRAPTQDRGNENSAIYFFDGKTNALLLPRDTFHQTDTMAVQFWMKHEQVRPINVLRVSLVYSKLPWPIVDFCCANN